MGCSRAQKKTFAAHPCLEMTNDRLFASFHDCDDILRINKNSEEKMHLILKANHSKNFLIATFSKTMNSYVIRAFTKVNIHVRTLL